MLSCFFIVELDLALLGTTVILQIIIVGYHVPIESGHGIQYNPVYEWIIPASIYAENFPFPSETCCCFF